jgi:hypothetical protein
MRVVSLTGPDSHRLTMAPGVGSLSIGPGREADVAPADRLDWTVLDPFSTPAGSPWPRWISYEGDDTGWLDWSGRRPVEGFSWTPHAAHDLDASRAGIHELSVTVRRAPLRLVLPAGRFAATGDLSLLTPRLAPGADCPALTFRPAPAVLPTFPALAGATSVDVSVPPLRAPFDCASLHQFPGVRQLVLAGSLTNLDALAELRGLTGLQLRYVPDLAGLPPLDTWPDLTHLIAWNVDDRAGRALRTEFRRSDREWRSSSVSKLRGPAWFTTEYGLPFSAWPSRSARAAVKAYRAAETAIGHADTEAAVEAAVVGFVQAINRLPDIETTEREDAADAVTLLTTATPLGDLSSAAAGWFTASREF